MLPKMLFDGRVADARGGKEGASEEEGKVDNTGIDPVTYRMQSDRSTI